jgi:hypothetical protein
MLFIFSFKCSFVLFVKCHAMPVNDIPSEGVILSHLVLMVFAYELAIILFLYLYDYFQTEPLFCIFASSGFHIIKFMTFRFLATDESAV